MGGDQLVPALVPGIDRDLHTAIEETRGAEYGKLIGEVQALDGARQLIGELKEGGATVVLASSSPRVPSPTAGRPRTMWTRRSPSRISCARRSKRQTRPRP